MLGSLDRFCPVENRGYTPRQPHTTVLSARPGVGACQPRATATACSRTAPMTSSMLAVVSMAKASVDPSNTRARGVRVAARVGPYVVEALLGGLSDQVGRGGV